MLQSTLNYQKFFHKTRKPGAGLGVTPGFGISISIFSGILLTTAFAPFAFFPSAVAAAALMLWVWRKASTLRQAAWHGYVFGIAHFASSVHWIYFSLHDFGGASHLFAGFATVLFVAVLSLYFALSGWLISAAAAGLRRSFHRLPVYASLWVVCEWLRSTLFTGFPWNLLGQSVVDSPFSGILPWFGVLGASWFVVFVAALVEICLSSDQTIKQRLRPGVVLLSALMAGYFCGFFDWTEPSSRAVKVGIVQSGIAQDLKFNPQSFRNILKVHQDLTDRLAGSDLVLWPETAIPAYYHQLETRVMLPQRRKIRAAGGGELLVGAFFRDRLSGTHYNSIVKVDSPPQAYHKRHLVPFGEYLPLRPFFELFEKQVMIPMWTRVKDVH